jgi:hypothetical protein
MIHEFAYQYPHFVPKWELLGGRGHEFQFVVLSVAYKRVVQ